MSNAITKASQYNLKSLYLSNDEGKKIDIRFLTNNITINENMTDGFISGKIVIFDGLSLYSEFPLRGQEYIEFEMEDFDRNKFNAKFFVFAYDGLKPVANNNDHMMQYTAHFASIHKVYNETAYIRQAFKFQNMHDYATEVFDGAFQGDAQEAKSLIIDPTDNPINLVAPGYNPIGTMHFFARKSYSNKWKSGAYRFYETKENFHFRNHESISEDYESGKKTAKEFGTNIVGDSSPEGQLMLRQNLVNFDFGTHVNTMSDLTNGIYNRQVMELDYRNRHVITTDYRHLDYAKDYKHPDKMKDIHDDKFNDLAYQPSIIMVNKNYLTPFDPYTQYNMGNTMTPDIIARKQVVFDLYHKSAIGVTIHGDLSINAGDMVKLKLPVYKAKTDSREVENPYNGHYLVDAIIHRFVNDEYYADMSLCRLGVRDYN